MAIARIASVPGTTLFKNSGGAGTVYSPANVAVALASPYSGWPLITSTTTVTPISYGDSIPDQYLWYLPYTDPSKVASGEIAYFYRSVTIGGAANSIPIGTRGLNILVVSDNAFLGRVTIMQNNASSANDVTVNLNDGIMALQVVESAPYNWQKVYSFPIEYTNAAALDSLRIDLELKVANYAASPAGNPLNPAGFQYDMQVYSLPSGVGFTNNTTFINPPNPLL